MRKNFNETNITNQFFLLVLIVFSILFSASVAGQIFKLNEKTSDQKKVITTTSETKIEKVTEDLRRSTEKATKAMKKNVKSTSTVTGAGSSVTPTKVAVENTSLGEFRLTAYCSCAICCGKYAYNRPTDKNGNSIVYGASGERLKQGVSVAADTSILPFGTEILINGHTYIVQDVGGAIKGNRIDIYFENHSDALAFGAKYGEVKLK